MLADEVVDLSWQNDISEYAHALLADERYTGTTLEKVECRETLCKAITIHADDSALTAFKQGGGSSGPWSEGEQLGSVDERDDGTLVTNMYFTKPGETSAFDEMAARLEAIVDAMGQ
jgi:hypothetical protein